MGILKVKPWGNDQGDHVLINEADFNPDFHEPFEAPTVDKTKAPTVDELRAALTEKGIDIPDGAKKGDLKALLDAANEPTE